MVEYNSSKIMQFLKRLSDSYFLPFVLPISITHVATVLHGCFINIDGIGHAVILKELEVCGFDYYNRSAYE